MLLLFTQFLLVLFRLRFQILDAGKVFALDARTGATLPGWPVTLPIDPFYEPVWGALALNGTSLYLATASYCDRRPYTAEQLTLIRIFDYAGAYGYDLAGAVCDKLAYNAKRADHKPQARLEAGGKKW